MMEHSLPATLPAMLLLMRSMGFMGSLHCIGMCGGLVGALSMSREKVWWSGLLAYQFGRVSTYAILGLFVGFSGAALSTLGGDQLQRIFAAFAALLMMFFALNLAGWLPDPLKRLSAWASRKTGLSHLAMRVSRSSRVTSWYSLGLINGLLPCGLVYAALSLALAAGNALNAVQMMLAFGLGTIPAMMFVPSILRGMTPSQRSISLRIAAMLILLLGMITLYRSVLPPHRMHNMAVMRTGIERNDCDHYFNADGLAKCSIGSASLPSIALKPTLS
ncbi:MAG: sulfite exporter TauE/SafE family protein [Mariprofundaceae bacterium]|nr:sulfite exporter TauE/SafE family protein [Mariprofundaceae bacterium]